MNCCLTLRGNEKKLCYKVNFSAYFTTTTAFGYCLTDLWSGMKIQDVKITDKTEVKKLQNVKSRDTKMADKLWVLMLEMYNYTRRQNSTFTRHMRWSSVVRLQGRHRQANSIVLRRESLVGICLCSRLSTPTSDRQTRHLFRLCDPAVLTLAKLVETLFEPKQRTVSVASSAIRCSPPTTFVRDATTELYQTTKRAYIA